MLSTRSHGAAWSVRFALIVAGLVAIPSAVAAQSSTTRGLSLGAHLQGASLTVEGGDAAEGGGLGLRVGYGINRIVTLFLRVDGSQVEVDDATINGQWQLAHAEIGGRFHFANSLRRLVPFLEVAAGGRVVSVDNAEVSGEDRDDVSFSGGALSLGGGLDVYFSETLALDLGLVWTGGEFNEVKVGSLSLDGLDIDARTFRFNVGLTWWP